ncbi:MAG TPA: tetratricopeptide repeat protein [Saprospiraceae bacterium]|nr:tetratricopeptide repeat protein [Saprospiraceae bacterium]HMP23175.1 tetratricopeptide repeat protein [Saprospiraceae bacterium]
MVSRIHRIMLFFVPLLLISLTACQNEQKQQQQAIGRLAQALDKQFEVGQAEALLTLYEVYLQKYGADEAYQYDKARLMSRLGQHEPATRLLLEWLQTYPTSARAPEAALLLAAVYEEKLQAYEAARSVYQMAQQVYSADETLQARTKTEWGTFDERMQQLRAQVFNERTGRVNAQAAQEFIWSAEVLATFLPKDTRAPELLFQAGDVAGAMGDYAQCLQLFERINEQYPAYEKSAQVLFMRAFTLDDRLGQLEAAKELYEAFLEKYPDDELAASARFSLENLGKSEEEIIQEFLRKQSEQ